MATKSKGWTSVPAVKIVSFILILTLTVTALTRLVSVAELAVETGIDPAVVLSDLSEHQHFFNTHMPRAADQARLVVHLQSEASIRAGEHIKWIEQDEWSTWNYYEIHWHINWNGYAEIFGTPETEEARAYYMQIVIDAQIRFFQRALEDLTNTEGLLFHLISDSAINSNVSLGQQTVDFFLSQPVHFVVGTDFNFSASHRPVNFEWSFPGRGAMLLAFGHETVAAHTDLYTSVRMAYLRDFGIMLGAALLLLPLLLVLLIGAGRRNREDDIQFSLIDKPYLDISLTAVIAWIALLVTLVWEFSWMIERYGNLSILAVLLSVAAVLTLTPTLLWLLSFAKRVKSGHFWRYTLIFVLLLWVLGFVVRFFQSLWTSLPLAAKLVIHPVRHAHDIYALEAGARRVEDGSWDEKINVNKGELGNIANSINNISTGIHLAVEERMKSERLKTELITNVSHDIRTPLTSIITYTDLLKQEGLDCEKAPEYLDILVQKSERLKTLTDELFEAAKAATGNIEVNITKLDFSSLMKQVLGELDATIQKSGLDLRVNMPEKLFVLADGKLMWRVMENLLSNVFKYALPGSRVYLDAKQTDFVACIDMKNISAVELNVDPAELTERFKRGDDSRTDGGTGLGLSIVQSFVAAQGGKFSIMIDGDLFKATVCVPMAEK